MANSTRVTTSELRSSADQLQQFAQSFQSQFEELFQRGKELDDTWDGDANDTFNTQTQGDYPKFEDMYKALTEYIKVLRDTADIYDKGETASVNQVTTRTKGH